MQSLDEDTHGFGFYAWNHCLVVQNKSLHAPGPQSFFCKREMIITTLKNWETKDNEMKMA